MKTQLYLISIFFAALLFSESSWAGCYLRCPQSGTGASLPCARNGTCCIRECTPDAAQPRPNDPNLMRNNSSYTPGTMQSGGGGSSSGPDYTTQAQAVGLAAIAVGAANLSQNGDALKGMFGGRGRFSSGRQDGSTYLDDNPVYEEGKENAAELKKSFDSVLNLIPKDAVAPVNLDTVGKLNWINCRYSMAAKKALAADINDGVEAEKAYHALEAIDGAYPATSDESCMKKQLQSPTAKETTSKDRKVTPELEKKGQEQIKKIALLFIDTRKKKLEFEERIAAKQEEITRAPASLPATKKPSLAEQAKRQQAELAALKQEAKELDEKVSKGEEALKTAVNKFNEAKTDDEVSKLMEEWGVN